MENKVSFYLLTDSHYISKKNWVEGKPFTLRERGDQIAKKLSPEILDTFIDKIIADTEIDTVLFTGDNVDDGDMNSHYEFRERLEKLRAAGKKVYVTYATHDYCGAGEDECVFMGSTKYNENSTEPLPFMHKGELYDFYKDYGPEQALSVHEESGSYVVRIGEGVRLAAIIDNGNGRSHCGLFEDGVEWLKNQIDEAKQADEFILLAVHHPVIAPFEVFRHVVEYELYGGYRELWNIMCEKNVRVVFTGHTHIQNIRKYEDENGSWFLDVSTIALANAAGKMRKIEVDTEKAKCLVTSVGIEKINGVESDKSAFEQLYYLNFPGIVEKLIPLANKDYDEFLSLAEGFLPVDKLKKFKFAVKPVFRKVRKMKMSTLVRLGKCKKQLTAEQIKAAKEEKFEPVLYEILKHIYTGNAPYSPGTLEYIAIEGVAARLDRIVNRFNIGAVKKIIPPGSSIAEIAEDFLYNNRTGDDDTIEFDLI